jgi:hypothetical protein
MRSEREDMNTATQGRVFTILHMRSEREDMNTATQGTIPSENNASNSKNIIFISIGKKLKKNKS